MDQATQLRQRWISEADRLRMFRRQRAVVHCNAARPLEDIVAEANALTPGTWEHAQRHAVEQVSR